MAKKKTKEVAVKLTRARTKKGMFVADNPDTPENEAFFHLSLISFNFISQIF